MKRPTIEMLLQAYGQGVFPMAHEDEGWEVYWYAPDPRAILPLDAFRTSRRLRQTVRQRKFEVRFNHDFRAVMQACAAPRPGDGRWISDDLIDAYCELHELGFAHSVECWQDGELAGGLYGVSLRGLFAGESMFHRRTDASKVALFHLVQRLRERGFVLLDTQFQTDHLARFGVVEITRAEYERRLDAAMDVEARFA